MTYLLKWGALLRAIRGLFVWLGRSGPGYSAPNQAMQRTAVAGR